jgi:hypothetical protein
VYYNLKVSNPLKNPILGWHNPLRAARTKIVDNTTREG